MVPVATPPFVARAYELKAMVLEDFVTVFLPVTPRVRVTVQCAHELADGPFDALPFCWTAVCGYVDPCISAVKCRLRVCLFPICLFADMTGEETVSVAKF